MNSWKVIFQQFPKIPILGMYHIFMSHCACVVLWMLSNLDSKYSAKIRPTETYYVFTKLIEILIYQDFPEDFWFLDSRFVWGPNKP